MKMNPLWSDHRKAKKVNGVHVTNLIDSENNREEQGSV